MNQLNEPDVTLMVVKFLCVACVAAIALGFACWRLSRRKDRIVPVRRKKSSEVAFNKWLNHSHHDLSHS